MTYKPASIPISKDAQEALRNCTAFSSMTSMLLPSALASYFPEAKVSNQNQGCIVTVAWPIRGGMSEYRKETAKIYSDEGFRKRVEDTIHNYFRSHQVKWFKRTDIEWESDGSAPLISIMPPGSGLYMHDQGYRYTAHNCDSEEQADVLMACACILLTELYTSLENRRQSRLLR